MKILALGAHPDDIEIGCGATLLNFAKKGAKIFFYIASHGEKGGHPRSRVIEQEASCALFPVEELFWGGLMDSKIDQYTELIPEISLLLDEIQPNYLFTHFPEDNHQDHRALAEAVLHLAKTKHLPLFFYEGPSTRNFQPSIFVDVESRFQTKLESLEKHRSQIHSGNSGDRIDIRHFATQTAEFRGAQAFVSYSEAFVPFLVRNLDFMADFSSQKNIGQKKRSSKIRMPHDQRISTLFLDSP